MHLSLRTASAIAVAAALATGGAAGTPCPPQHLTGRRSHHGQGPSVMLFRVNSSPRNSSFTKKASVTAIVASLSP